MDAAADAAHATGGCAWVTRRSGKLAVLAVSCLRFVPREAVAEPYNN